MLRDVEDWTLEVSFCYGLLPERAWLSPESPTVFCHRALTVLSLSPMSCHFHVTSSATWGTILTVSAFMKVGLRPIFPLAEVLGQLGHREAMIGNTHLSFVLIKPEPGFRETPRRSSVRKTGDRQLAVYWGPQLRKGMVRVPEDTGVRAWST